ncbi:MAG TPA: DUF4168 domain-containing protein [Acidobacteriota bacterium]|nr:DUF4168 domain-containing protein [Acidobacteriota bacterium]
MLDISLNRMVLSAMAVLWVASARPLTIAQESSHRESASGLARVNDKDLRAFVHAYVEYHRIRQTYEAELAKVHDPKERAKIQGEGDAKVRQILERQNLTPESYNRLFSAVNGNEQLRRKTLKLIEEERNRT